MPRFTAKKQGSFVTVADATDDSTYVFAASLGDDFFSDLLFELNIQEQAELNEQQTLTEHGVEVG